MSIGSTPEPRRAATAGPAVPARSGTRFLLLNSAVAFALALMTMVTLHELAHAVTALSLGLNATLHSGSVDVPDYRSDSEHITTALAGPFFSLISGLLILALPRFGRGFWRLFVMWLGLLSVQEVVGYLMTAPFVTFGDIGAALRLAGAPFWTFIVCFLLGLARMVLLGRAATRRLLEFTREGIDSTADQLRSLGLFAWLLGVLGGNRPGRRVGLALPRWAFRAGRRRQLRHLSGFCPSLHEGDDPGPRAGLGGWLAGCGDGSRGPVQLLPAFRTGSRHPPLSRSSEACSAADSSSFSLVGG